METDEDLSTQFSTRLHFLLKVGGLLQSGGERALQKGERSGLESALSTKETPDKLVPSTKGAKKKEHTIVEILSTINFYRAV